MITCSNSNMLQQMTQCYKCYGKLFGVAGQRASQMYESAYYDCRDELTLQDQFVFKGQCLVIPAAMRKEMMAVAHATHIGMEGCIRRARDSMYWPRMSTELKEYISKCDVCLAHRVSPGKEPLLQYEVVECPWSKISADLCELNGHHALLVVWDYYSNFIEVENLNKITTHGVTKALKTMFARYDVPDVVVSDNGPQLDSPLFLSTLPSIQRQG